MYAPVHLVYEHMCTHCVGMAHKGQQLMSMSRVSLYCFLPCVCETGSLSEPGTQVSAGLVRTPLGSPCLCPHPHPQRWCYTTLLSHPVFKEMLESMNSGPQGLYLLKHLPSPLLTDVFVSVTKQPSRSNSAQEKLPLIDSFPVGSPCWRRRLRGSNS